MCIYLYQNIKVYICIKILKDICIKIYKLDPFESYTQYKRSKEAGMGHELLGHELMYINT